LLPHLRFSFMIAGLFTLVRGRIMYKVAFGD
jgi:uncharacterized membrane protein